MDTLIVATVSGIVSAAASWGMLRTEVKNMKASLRTLHKRVDVLMLSLAKSGFLDIATISNIDRET